MKSATGPSRRQSSSLPTCYPALLTAYNSTLMVTKHTTKPWTLCSARKWTTRKLIKIYGDAEDAKEKRYSPPKCIETCKRRVFGNPDLDELNTSYVERQNLSMRMGMRRFTRLTNAFSKKLEHHLHMLSLYFVYYNFVKIHTTIKVTPAMAARVTDKLRDVEWIIGLIDAREAKPNRPKKYKKQISI